ncbi:uncharacterized protein LOC125522675 [Triticum urartu]|uniref:uncharacterized protein LOC125522675 n=1 Tax=Triticum urartu TaxID=4572 RepID=UPI0020432683|nr:uncharacterized protein LOC125522675 [Triticum urartu]
MLITRTPPPLYAILIISCLDTWTNATHELYHYFATCIVSVRQNRFSGFFEQNRPLGFTTSGSTDNILAIANDYLQVVREFGSFDNYCWSFVNHRPITNGFRYARQVPTKTPKSEAMSKDLMRRGFQCVGPTTVYSFMQVAGIVNDHLRCCFRFDQAGSQPKAAEENMRADIRLGSPASEDSEISEV